MVTGTKFQKHVKDYITQHEHTLTNLNHFKRYYTMKKNLFLRAITISHKWPPESTGAQIQPTASVELWELAMAKVIVTQHVQLGQKQLSFQQN